MGIIFLKIFISISYIGMIIVNYLANSIPFNDQNTGVVSSKYPSFFTPAGFTFSIWGIIYLFLGIYVVKMIFTSSADLTEQYLTTTMILFIATSILNIAWLFSWHYDYIVLSTVIMAVFLVLLLIAMSIIPSESILIKSAFSLYAAWLSVAFVANVTIMIVYLIINFFLQREVLWYIVIILVGLVLVSLVLFTSKNVVYGLVFVWAYFGIFMKHKSQIDYYLTNSWAPTYTGVILIFISLLTIVTFVLNDFRLFQK
jgi:hypothetical protein